MIKTDVMARKPFENYEKYWEKLISTGFSAIVTYFWNQNLYSCLVCLNACQTYIIMQILSSYLKA